jgi:NAD(P)-dependent dehydrogenase (short-subunit alcohol dehydrogenase family)
MSTCVSSIISSGQGIARTIALRLADDGFDVAVSDVEVGELVDMANEIESKGRQCSIHVADVSIEDSVKKLVENVVKEHGGLDVVSLSQSFSKNNSRSLRIYRWLQMQVKGNRLSNVTSFSCQPFRQWLLKLTKSR